MARGASRRGGGRKGRSAELALSATLYLRRLICDASSAMLHRGDEFANHHAARIVFNGSQKGLPAQHKAALVVVELEVLIDHCCQLFVVAVIRRFKQIAYRAPAWFRTAWTVRSGRTLRWRLTAGEKAMTSV